jgi:hypothetical protein
MSKDNPLVDDVSLVSQACSSKSAYANFPGASDAFSRIVDTLRRAGLYRFPGEDPPEKFPQPKRKMKRKGGRSKR